ncbi:MAG: Eco57I restriction-modification methylase domain-containing protein [Coriobacteriia bacterium]
MAGSTGVSIDDFLAGSTARSIDWAAPPDTPPGLRTVEVLFGQGDKPLELAVATSSAAPRADDLRRLWKTRANRGAPVLLVVLHVDSAVGLRASVIGTEGEPSPLLDLSGGRVERIAAAALAEPNRHQAVRALDRLLSSVSREGMAAGLINSGLFAAHELRDGVPHRRDWEAARERSVPLLTKTGRSLLESLGFCVEAKGSALLALSDDGTHHAIAVVLEESESFDRTSQRFGGVSPVSQALALAQKERLPWVVALRRNQVRLYPADPDVGVGRKGLTETYVELDLALLDDSEAGYLALIFSPEALAAGGSVDEIIRNSSVYATDLGARLRGRVYEDVVPDLAVAVARRMRATTETDLNDAYHRTLVILFRLLFVAYAEDRELLPFGKNDRYTRNALKTYAQDFARDPGMEFSPESTSIWDDLVQVWNVVDSGDPAWDVPAYNGGLFSTDPVTHPEGALVSSLKLTNAEIGPALRAMLVDSSGDEVAGPVDFRSLSVREFGTIYEGLLESSLSFAPSDLTLDRDQTYVPAKDGDEVVVGAGDIYFHNASGQRKSTGSYFTKAFAVEHLLDTALEPAITEHLAGVASLIAHDDTRQAAGDAFFDFRVADLAMGSGHFLVAAIDRIESRFSAFLTEHHLPAIADELQRLDSAARKALGEQGEVAEIEPSLLLRRQIARRCIYGLDINLIAVELARLAIWIHTFVPGLPMSSLDHGLVHANSLTGMGTIEETLLALDPQSEPGQFSLFSASIEDALEASRATLLKVAKASEATKQEVRDAEQERLSALAAAEDARLLMDAAVAVRLGLLPIPTGPEEAVASITADTPAGARARETLAALMPAHFPFLFPEVFLRKRPGYDVLLGNPPWEKVHVEAHAWWGLRFPGLRGLSAKEREALLTRLPIERPDLQAEYEREIEETAAIRDALLAAGFPGVGSGHLDLYKAFAWKDWRLLRPGGRFGVVFPRGVLSGSGTAAWREEILAHGSFSSVTTLTNTGQWVFDGVDGRYSIALVSVQKAEAPEGERAVSLVGPFYSHDGYLAGRHETLSVAAEEFAGWAKGAAFPLLPTAASAPVFARMRLHPAFSSDDMFEFRPIQGDLNATSDRELFDFDLEDPKGDTPVIAGASFNLWEPDFGLPYAYADGDAVLAHLQAKRQRQSRTASSAFHGMDVSSMDTLPCLSPRIAFRDVTNQTNQRTLLACLIPGGVVLVHNAPYLYRLGGTAGDEAYLLGVMSSLPLDWYSRRFVEMHVTFDVLSAFPVPRPPREDALRRRVIEIAASLASVDTRYGPWLKTVSDDIGVALGPPRRLTEAEQFALVTELDALTSLLYGLSEDEVEVVFETFHRGWDYRTRLDAVLGYYATWEPAARAAGHLGGGAS